MPILHLSQLIGVAAGLEESELKFKRHVVSVEPVVEKLEAVEGSSSSRWRRARRPALAWGHFEAGWVRLETLRVPAAGPAAGARRAADRAPLRLPPRRALARAWRRSSARSSGSSERQPDLTLISGDLLSRPRGEPRLRELLARLPRCFAVLGNHDFALDARPVLAAGRGGRPRAGDAARRRLARRSSCAAGASRSSASTRARIRSAPLAARAAGRPGAPTCGSCSATSRT